MDEDAGLLQQIARGDQRALEELYGRYEKRLFGFGVRLLGDHGLAEELVQETFVRIWREAGRFDAARGSGSAFLFTLARRLAIDIYRRPSSRPIVLERPDPEQDPADEIATSVTVRAALDGLSEPHREVLELLHGQGMTQSEAAEALGIPLGTVKTRALYALRAMRLALQEAGVHA